MNKPKIEEFLENNNMHFLFCLLSDLEVQRLNNLPTVVRQNFDKKITEVAMDHVAANVIPDYIVEQFEEEVEPEAPLPRFDDDDEDEMFEDEVLVADDEDLDFDNFSDEDDND
ncbi:MAG TPA: hypothetical protein PLE74_10330 [Candidatus Cloacimonadota bacterium]|nr:hypothetical protein [Candidatus Cloacimonadota bacterium]HPT72664.1 hypothetical protein [Candidatus Cloacimonadota bacterium]